MSFFFFFGQIFARRGLIKIDELKQLENTGSSLENTETQKIFREATLKVSHPAIHYKNVE